MHSSEQFEQFVQQHGTASLPPAWLWIAPDTEARRARAQHLSQFLLCQQPIQASLQPCQQCVSCHQCVAATHPERLWLQPEADSPNLIPVQAVRQIHQFCQLRATGNCQIVIIEAAEKLNLAAANALLKILEEPPPRVFIWLLAAHTGSLPATLLSRCHKVVWPSATGSAQHPAIDTMFKVLMRLGQGEAVALTGVAQTWAKQWGADCLVWLWWIYSDLVRCRYVSPAKLAVLSYSSQVNGVAGQCSMQAWLTWMRQIQDYRRHLSQHPQLNVALFLEALLVELRQNSRI